MADAFGNLRALGIPAPVDAVNQRVMPQNRLPHQHSLSAAPPSLRADVQDYLAKSLFGDDYGRSGYRSAGRMVDAAGATFAAPVEAGLLAYDAGVDYAAGNPGAAAGGMAMAALGIPGSAAGRAALKGTFDATDNVPLTYKGKDPSDWSPTDFEEVGGLLGVDRLGPATPPAVVRDMDGREIQIPGGMDGKFTYYDMLSLKSQGIDASRLPPDLHAQLQKKITRSMYDDKGLSDEQVWSGLVFGMTSPNNPLFPNQLAMSRLRINRPEDLDRLANMIDWEPGETVPAAKRAEASAAITRKYGLNAAEQGGLGVSGSTDYTRVAEMAKLFRDNKDWFRRQPDEPWDSFVERVATQVAGLKMKTGSFGLVWQDPAAAAVSAVDRHMAKIFENEIFKNNKDRIAWEKRGVALYNKRQQDAGKKGKAKTIKDLPNGFIGEMLLSEVGKTKSPKYKVKNRATGEFEVNPAAGERLGSTKFIVEPKNFELMGDTYKRVLAANAREAEKHGFGLFESQWHLWDRQRRRLEPHENMFPGLERVPRMSTDQLRAVDKAHNETGHKVYTKEMVDGQELLPRTRPISNPARLGYFTAPAALGYGLLGPQEDDQVY